MTKLEQIVAIHVGQAGLQIATAFWELICIEHGIGPDGVPTSPDIQSSEYDSAYSLFDVGNIGTYIPRAIFIDSESPVIDEIKTGTYGSLFNHGMMINQAEDAANNFARGTYTVGKQMIGKIKECTRKTSENTDSLRTFLMLNSTGGGTGSGLSPLIMLTLMNDFPKVTRSCFSVVPANAYTSAIVEPYNMLLNNFSALETCDINFLFDNEAIYGICNKKLFINSPSFTDINRILAMMLNSITSTFRYPSTLRSSLADTLTNLIPYPRIHFPIVRYAPINHVSRSSYDRISTTDLTKELFSKDNQSLNVNTGQGLFISMLLNYQGIVNTNEIYKAIEHIKTSNTNKFVEWSPTGFKVGICNQIPSVSPMLEMCSFTQAGTMIINSTALNQFFLNQTRKFDLIYNKRAFIHWYFGEGMEDIEFFDTRAEIEMIIGDYNEIGMTEKLIAEESYRSKGRNVSIRLSQTQEPKTDQ